MDINLLKPLVEQIKGCTFANLDALCEPRPGVMERITGERLILYRTDGASGYEKKVKRALIASGKNPDLFHVGPLPWGTRVGNLPIIEHKGNYYLQAIILAKGTREYFLAFGGQKVNPEDFGIKKHNEPQSGLTVDAMVHVRTFKVENIEKIRLMGETLTDTSVADKATRAILTIKA